MQERLDHYIDGRWVPPKAPRRHELIDPATERPFTAIALGSAEDVDRAVVAARRAFEQFSRTSVRERADLLERILAIYQRRSEDLAEAITAEMGAPAWLARAAHVYAGLVHFQETLAALRTHEFRKTEGALCIVREPVGACALITPWNWPQNQVVCKVAPALAAGCSMLLKPSESAPLDAIILAEILDEAGVPPGVFNLVNGDGSGVGAALAAHPGIDMISFTGSTRAGIEVSKVAAETIKRVALELGGKSANILLEDVELERAVAQGVAMLMINSGQNCNAPSRMLVPRPLYREAVSIAEAAAGSIEATDPRAGTPGSLDLSADLVVGSIGPVANARQFERVQDFIRIGCDEGAKLVAGGLGRPAGMSAGFYVRPTVFADVDNSMRIAREEIFGPVLCLIPYDTEDEAVRLANDSAYGLSGYVQSRSRERARAVALRLRTGMVHLNGAHEDPKGAFGGYKQSGNGREFGKFGLEEYLEIKSVFGWSES